MLLVTLHFILENYAKKSLTGCNEVLKMKIVIVTPQNLLL